MGESRTVNTVNSRKTKPDLLYRCTSYFINIQLSVVNKTVRVGLNRLDRFYLMLFSRLCQRDDTMAAK